MSQALIAPSILSANMGNLAQEVQSVEQAGADWIHVDVMDGHFVPNLTFGPLIVKALKPVTKLPLDCHLMIENPEKWVEEFAKVGATGITVHVEATAHLDRLLHQIRDYGCQVGVSLNPATPLASLEEIYDLVDLVLVMSVNPGFGGQKFIDSAKSKIQNLKNARDKKGLSFKIQVDGGVSAQNIGELKKAGADVFVAGSAIFSKSDRKKAIEELRSALS